MARKPNPFFRVEEEDNTEEEDDFSYGRRRPNQRYDRSGLNEDRENEKADDPLWTQYNIRRDTSLRSTVEQLLLLDVQLEDIINLIQNRHTTVTDNEIKNLVGEIVNRWKQIGRTPTVEERELERGKMISSLMRLKIKVEEAHRKAADGRNLATLLAIENKLATLRNLDVQKGEVGSGGDPEEQAFRNQLDNLTVDQLQELVRVLDKNSHSSGSSVSPPNIAA